MMVRSRIRRTNTANRRGAALVEFALVAPVFLFLVLATIEFGRMIMVQQILTNAAREGARRAVVEGSTPSEVESLVANYLSRSSVSGATVEVSPRNLGSVGFGDDVTVTVSVPFDTVSWTGTPWMLRDKTLKARTTMQAERLQ